MFGFARTLGRVELPDPASRYVEMIDAAAAQMGELLDELGLVARIESGRYAPALAEADSLALARRAAADLGAERAAVSGEGALVLVDADPAARALSRLARAAARHGGHESVEVHVRGETVEIGPVARNAVAVLVGEELRELGAAAAVVVLRALGGSVAVEGERLVVRLPAA